MTNNIIACAVHLVLSGIGFGVLSFAERYYCQLLDEIALLAYLLLIVPGYIACGYLLLKDTSRKKYLSVMLLPCLFFAVICYYAVLGILEGGVVTEYLLDYQFFNLSGIAPFITLSSLLDTIYFSFKLGIFSGLIDALSTMFAVLAFPISFILPSLLLLLGMQLKKRQLSKIADDNNCNNTVQ